jgi:hypothetical protein
VRQGDESFRTLPVAHVFGAVRLYRRPFIIAFVDALGKADTMTPMELFRPLYARPIWRATRFS